MQVPDIGRILASPPCGQRRRVALRLRGHPGRGVACRAVGVVAAALATEQLRTSPNGSASSRLSPDSSSSTARANSTQVSSGSAVMPSARLVDAAQSGVRGRADLGRDAEVRRRKALGPQRRGGEVDRHPAG